MKMFDNFCEKKTKKNKHFVELISNFNNLSDFSHSSTFQTRVYFFFKTVQKSYLLKITVFIETAFIAFMYIHDYVFFSLCVRVLGH